MASRTIYPLEAPGLPHWRGISDLAGYTGDLFHGAYDRSPNFFVHNATAIAKRRGFTRGFNELFPGQAAAEYSRNRNATPLVIGDGTGVKVIDSVPTDGGWGENYDNESVHAGFPSDNFRSGNNVNVDNTNLGRGRNKWCESDQGGGANEPSFHGEDSTTHYEVKDLAQIYGRAWMPVPTTGAAGVPGTDVEYQPSFLAKSAVETYYTGQSSLKEPSPFYVTRCEIDLSKIPIGTGNLSLGEGYGRGGTGAATDPPKHFFAIAQGLPGKCENLTKDGTVSGNLATHPWGPANAVNYAHNQFQKATPWTGAVAILQFKQREDAGKPGYALADLRFNFRLRGYEFLCNQAFKDRVNDPNPNPPLVEPSNIKGAAHNGPADQASEGASGQLGIPAVDGVNQMKNLTVAELQTTHVLEFGRVITGIGSSGFKWTTQVRFWQGKTLASMSGFPGDPDITLIKEETANKDVVQVSGENAIHLQHPDNILQDQFLGKGPFMSTFAGVGMASQIPNTAASVSGVTLAANTGIRCSGIEVHNRFIV